MINWRTDKQKLYKKNKFLRKVRKTGKCRKNLNEKKTKNPRCTASDELKIYFVNTDRHMDRHLVWFWDIKQFHLQNINIVKQRKSEDKKYLKRDKQTGRMWDGWTDGLRNIKSHTITHHIWWQASKIIIIICDSGVVWNVTLHKNNCITPPTPQLIKQT